nr:nucleotide sugar dehydrogenase [Candidatus Omnitrophota bacterium]
MKIAIVGLGYVGTVTGACLAETGHYVIGVDINKDKVNTINRGKSPIIEKGLDRVVLSTVKNKHFLAVNSIREAVLKTDVAMICIGTPSMKSGCINLEYLKRAVAEIGEILKEKKRFYTLVIRSTIMPGTTEDTLIPLLEQASGGKVDKDFGVCVNPEFMREGDSLEDFYKPAKVIIGFRTKKEYALLRKLYSFLKANMIATDIKTAEFSKYLDNVFHGLKACFANEIGVIAGRIGIDAKKAMEILCQDAISNISSRYLKPGFAFGGSCLPKDIRAVLYRTKTENLTVPLIGSILKSNDMNIKRVFRRIIKTKKKKIGILGLSFKPGTDDLRESQIVKLAELLIKRGCKVKIYDKNISIAKIIGSNKAYMQRKITRIQSLLCSSLDDVIKTSEIVIVGHDTKYFQDSLKKANNGQMLIDLAQ